MKRLLLIAGILLGSSAAHAVNQTFNACTGCPDFLGTGGAIVSLPLPAGATNYVQVSTGAIVQPGAFDISSGTLNTQLTLPYIANTLVPYVGPGGALTSDPAMAFIAAGKRLELLRTGPSGNTLITGEVGGPQLIFNYIDSGPNTYPYITTGASQMGFSVAGSGSALELTIGNIGGNFADSFSVDGHGLIGDGHTNSNVNTFDVASTFGNGGSSFGYGFSEEPTVSNGGIQVKYNASVSTLTVRSMAGGGTQCVQVDNNGNQSGTGSACGSGGGGGATAGNIVAAAQFSAPYYSVQGTTTTLAAFPNVTLSTNTGVTIATATTMGNATSTTFGNLPYVTVNSSGSSQNIVVNINGQPSGGVQNKSGGVTINALGPVGPAVDMLVLHSSYTSAQAGSAIVGIWQDNANRNDPDIWIHDVSNNSGPDIRFDRPSPNVEMVNTSTDNAHGYGKWEPFASAFQSIDMQCGSNRAYDNSTFENLCYLHPLDALDSPPGAYYHAQDRTNDSGVLASSDTSAVSFYTLNSHTVGLTGPANNTASYTFGLPDTVGSTGNLWYNSGSRGGNFNVRQMKHTGADFSYSPTTGVSISTITVSSFTSTGGANFTGAGDGGISFTIGVTTSGVISSTSQITVGHLLCSGSTNYTATDCGLPGTGGSGTSFSMAITTGPSTTYSNPTLSSSSVNTVLVFNQSQFNGTATGTTYYASINTSSITAQGPLPTLLGTVTQGVWSATRLVAGEIPTDVAYTDLDNNWSHAQTSNSSWTITAGGIEALATGNSFAYIAAFSTSAVGTPLVSISTQPAVLPSDYELLVTSPVTNVPVFGIQADGHVISSGTAPTVSSCGTSPTMDPNSTDFAGTINTGSASPTACTLTFANAFVNVPVCVVSDDLQTAEPAITTRAKTGFTVTLGAALNSGHLFYICVGSKQ